jgi:uracil-DNA glycosylase
MRTAVIILTEELRRLKAAGVKSVAVSEQGLAALRAAAQGRDGRLARPNSATPFPPPPVVVLPAGDKAARWAALRDLVLDDPICRARVRPGKKVVLGVGSLDARIMFVGEAPGADEEMQGEPFVGPAGKLLDRMIGGMGIKRGDVYIGNIMNWRPEMPVGADGVQYGNRPPTEDEMTYCLPYLRAQIEIVNPDILVALGNTAAQGLLGFGAFRALGEVRGRWRDFSGKPLMVTYHPSYILRNRSNQAKRMIWEDLLKVMERAGLPISEKQRSYFLEP